MKTRVGDSWSSVLISALERASLTGVKRVVLVPSTVPFTPPALLLWLTESPSVFIEKYQNNASIELQNAANEQQKITENRLVEIVKDQKNLKEEGARHSQIDRRAAKLAQQLTDVASQGKSAITTHILDTSRGRPASGVSIDLHFVPNTSYRECPHQRNWILLGGGRTNKGGRLTTLLPDGVLPKPGVYCLTFHVGEYFEMCREEHSTLLQPVPFYPLVNVYFTIRPDQVHEHFHVPLTWNPFGYSTYRGS